MREVKIDSMDCHAVQAPLAMTEKGKFLNTPQDFFTRLQIFLSTKSKNTYRILGFLMRNRGFQGAGAGIYLGDNEQARAAESTIYRAKLTPKMPKNLGGKAALRVVDNA